MTVKKLDEILDDAVKARNSNDLMAEYECADQMNFIIGELKAMQADANYEFSAAIRRMLVDAFPWELDFSKSLFAFFGCRGQEARCGHAPQMTLNGSAMRLSEIDALIRLAEESKAHPEVLALHCTDLLDSGQSQATSSSKSAIADCVKT